MFTSLITTRPEAVAVDFARPALLSPQGGGCLLRDRARSDLAEPVDRNLIVCGVTTEVCVNTTVREANDRGYRGIVPADCGAPISLSFMPRGWR
jgi:hypothetical protein